MIVALHVTVEVPDIDTIALTDTDDLVVVSWIEDDCCEWISVTDEALEEEWNGLLGVVIPNLDHTVLTSCQHVPRIARNIN